MFRVNLAEVMKEEHPLFCKPLFIGVTVFNFR